MVIENYPTFLDDFDDDVDDDDTSDFLSLITSNDSNERIPPL